MRHCILSKKNFQAFIFSVLVPVSFVAGCAPADVPGGRSAHVPTVASPTGRYEGLNERHDPITRVKLGRDVLVPHKAEEDPLPRDIIGPFELRGETLASALQLVLDDYDVSLAFETDAAMVNRISVANLRGTVKDVVARVCGLANLYCTYKDEVLTVKETELFIVDLPPQPATSSNTSGTSGTSGSTTSSSSSSSSSSRSSSGSSSSSDDDAYNQIADGLEAITGTIATVDTNSRVMIYAATQRTQRYAERYFEKLRKNTALIIYETHIWEVTLDNENRTGIDWSVLLNNVGNFSFNVVAPGGAPAGAAAPISITPTYTGSSDLTPTAVLEFISEQGTVKTVSQPQLTVLSGASATLEVRQEENYVSGVSRTPSTTPGVADTVSTTTGTIETGLGLTIGSAWDRSTVYGNVTISIDELLNLDTFNPDPNTTIQLPRTTTRGLQTYVRVRPGDAILIGGLVTQKDSYNGSGPGFMKPLFTTSRQATTRNTELVFLLRPRVVVYEPGDVEDTVPVVDAVPAKVDDRGADDGIAGYVNRIFSGNKPDKGTVALPGGVSASALTPAAQDDAAPDYLPEMRPLPPEPLVFPDAENESGISRGDDE